MNKRMTESERETLCRRIDELCAEVETLKRDEWAAGFNAGCDAVEAAYEDGRPYYEEENAKLRELVAALADCRNTTCGDCVRWDYPEGGCSLDGVMRELGVEVVKL